MIIKSEVKKQIISDYPGLEFKNNSNTLIEGTFGFKATFDNNTNKYTINPMKDDRYTIIDNYQIRIEVPSDKELPAVFETGKRIPAELDFHKYENGQLCLAGPFDTMIDFTMDQFIDVLVLEFFYDQSFKKKFGYWPRGVYSHKELGFVENYFDRIGQISDLEEKCLAVLSQRKEFRSYLDAIISNKQIKGHHPCVCGSGKQYRKCHDKVFKGLWNLQKYVVRYRKNIKM